MDSMSADLMRGLETTLPTSFSAYFNRERFCASLVSGDIDGAEAYLSEFTKTDSNFQSNVMFYLLQRQRFFKCLIDRDLLGAAVMMFCDGELTSSAIPETKDFIRDDIKRYKPLGSKCEAAWCGGGGSTFDITPFANAFTNEMLQMMNHLVAMNPDLRHFSSNADIKLLLIWPALSFASDTR